MIKVIKHGNKQRVVCPDCECEFIYEHEDVHSIQVDYNQYESFVKCPDCGGDVTAIQLYK